MYSGFNSSENPKDMFLNLIIYNLKKMSRCRWGFPSKPGEAVRLMRALIGDLDEKSKRKLKNIYDRLTVLAKDISFYSEREMEEMYSELMIYLHATYFRNLLKSEGGEMYG